MDQRTKHINLRFYFVREKLAEGLIGFEHCPTEGMVADIWTKNLPRDAFERHQAAILNIR